VQQDTVGHRGQKHDPLYKIRGLLRHGTEHLTPRQIARLDAGLAAGDPDWEVTVAWGCYQRLRSIYHARSPAQGRRTAEEVIASLPTCPIGEVARLGRTLRSWRAQVLAYFDTGGVSNGGTEAINLLIEKTRRLAHGFRNFTHYGYASSSLPAEHAPTAEPRPMHRSEEPHNSAYVVAGRALRPWPGPLSAKKMGALHAHPTFVTQSDEMSNSRAPDYA
jgi:hypothetical protein